MAAAYILQGAIDALVRVAPLAAGGAPD
jgi:hypothetical protein